MKKILFILLFFVSTTTYPQYPQTELVKYAESYLFVREIKPNRSPEIDSMNTAVHVPLGSSWCASFVSWVFTNNYIPNPQSAWSPNFAKQKDKIWGKNLKNNINIKQDDVCTFYYSNLGRVGHVEIIYKADDKYIYTISGNTNVTGSREGDGCYRKKRELSKVYAITRYIK
jgi:hypothetical protein